MGKGLIPVLLLLLVNTSCNRTSSHGANSDVLLGKWGHLAHGETPELLRTYDNLYNFENSGTGKYTYTETSTKNDQLEYSYSNEYQVEWHCFNNGSEDFVVITKTKGRNLDIRADNVAKIKQNVEIELNKSDGLGDTLYFRVKDSNTLMCHYAGNKDEWKMTKRE